MAGTASKKTGLSIPPTQIAHLILSEFKCATTLRDSNGNNLILQGSVTDMRSHPLRIDFYAPEGTAERELFKEKSAKEKDMMFECQMSTMGKFKKQNVLRIYSHQMQSLGVADELMGPASSAYVTRTQLAKVANKLHSSLNVYEDYDMPEYQFSEAFVDDLLRDSAAKFSNVDMVEVIEQTALTYDFRNDLQASQITEQLGSVFEVSKNGSTDRIAINKEGLESLKKSGLFSLGTHSRKEGTKASESSNGSSKSNAKSGEDSSNTRVNTGVEASGSANILFGLGGASVHSLFNVDVDTSHDSSHAKSGQEDDARRLNNLVSDSLENSKRFVEENGRDWTSSNASLDDQLKQLNNEAQSDIKWEFKGNKIIPMSIKVAKMMRSTFERSTTLERVRKVFTETLFLRTPTLYTSKAPGLLSTSNAKLEQVSNLF